MGKQTGINIDEVLSVRKSNLTGAQRALLSKMQSLNFGRIEQLHVRDGQPVLNPPPRVIREHKFGADNQPRPELEHDDFPLKRQVIELFDTMTRLRTGQIESLEIKHGLPFHMNVVESIG